MGDGKATKNIYAGNQNGDCRQKYDQNAIRGDLQQCADNDDTADGIGYAHKRRMQRRGHIPDDHIADKTGQHKNGKMGHESGRCNAAQAQ